MQWTTLLPFWKWQYQSFLEVAIPMVAFLEVAIPMVFWKWQYQYGGFGGEPLIEMNKGATDGQYQAIRHLQHTRWQMDKVWLNLNQFVAASLPS